MRLIAPGSIDLTAIQVLAVLEHQLGQVDSVDALLLVGGFSRNEYLFDRIRVSLSVLLLFSPYTSY
jgi:hypothetical protein